MRDPTADFRHVFRDQKQLADQALAQVDDASFLTPLEGESDPLGVTVKHVGGNLRSRWRDFLTTDGEKPDRHRDREFELGPGDDRAALMALWEAGWGELFGALEELRADDWSAVVTIRGEPHTVLQATLRSLAHTSYHVGQIVKLARRAAGPAWQTLSIQRGGSEAFRKRPKKYLEGGNP
jgi:hypothetical protein